jgi:CRISPR-associated protein Cmr4
VIRDLVYFYLIAPLHTGGTTQEGNLLGIARESHTELPYIPSSTIRGRLRASITNRVDRIKLFGPELEDVQTFAGEYKQATGKDLTQLEQGDIWIGDASILWLPVPSLSHGVIWVSCPMLLQRWARLHASTAAIPADYSTNLKNGKPIYLKDAILKADDLHNWDNWQNFVPQSSQTASIHRVLVLPDKHCTTLIQMSLWRQVKIKLDQHKAVDGGFRYEEAIPPDTLMYFSWGLTSQANGTGADSRKKFQDFLAKPEDKILGVADCSYEICFGRRTEYASQNKFHSRIKQYQILQIGGQESLGRGFVQTWLNNNGNN